MLRLLLHRTSSLPIYRDYNLSRPQINLLPNRIEIYGSKDIWQEYNQDQTVVYTNISGLRCKFNKWITPHFRAYHQFNELTDQMEVSYPISGRIIMQNSRDVIVTEHW